jgi:transposase InsO family protein
LGGTNVVSDKSGNVSQLANYYPFGSVRQNEKAGSFVRLAKGFCYVAIILDVFTKKVVGWSVELHMETSLVVDALNLALCGGTPEYHHSDRGGQYCSFEYTGMLKENEVKISMADTGVSVDNPYAEAFNRTLKVEEVYLADYDMITDARASLKHFIEVVYNKKTAAFLDRIQAAGRVRGRVVERKREERYYVSIINPPDEQKEGFLPFPKRGSDQKRNQFGYSPRQLLSRAEKNT